MGLSARAAGLVVSPKNFRDRRLKFNLEHRLGLTRSLADILAGHHTLREHAMTVGCPLIGRIVHVSGEHQAERSEFGIPCSRRAVFRVLREAGHVAPRANNKGRSEGEERTFDCTFWLNKPGGLR